MSEVKKYKVKIETAPIEDQEIEQFKNFNRVLSQYKRRKRRVPLHMVFYRSNKMMLIFAIIILTILIVFYYNETDGKKEEQKDEPKIERIEKR